MVYRNVPTFVEPKLVKNYDDSKDGISFPIFSQPKLDALYAEYIQHGFEGQMISLNTKYENKCAKNLLKRKDFQDKEYTIQDICEEEGNKSEMAGAIAFKNEL